MLSQFKFPYIIESSIIIAFGYIIYMMLFASDKAYIRNRIFLLSLLVLSFLLPLISLPVYAQKVVMTSKDAGQIIVPFSNHNVIAETGLDWHFIISRIYLGVVALLLVRLMYHIVYISRIINKSESKIIDDVRHLITDKLTTPASIFNILLTDNSNLPKAVIDHEKVHMRHGHTWDVLIMEIVKVILWFNPFVYLISRELKDNHEFIADHLASKSVQDELEYSSLLLQYAKSIKTPLLLNTFSTITKKRIIMLNKKTTTNHWKSLLILPLFMVLFSIFSCENYDVPVNSDGKKLKGDLSEVRLDTIIVFDSDTYDELMTIEKVYVNDITVRTDTTIVFDFDTKEEKIKVVKSESPRKEILMETYVINEYDNQTGDLKTNTYKRYPQELVEVVDTVITFDYDTYEEHFQVVKGMTPRKELVWSVVTPKNQLNKEQNFDRTFELTNKTIIQSDTIFHKPLDNE